MSKRGHFIVIDGTDGSGKATQVRLLRKNLQVRGVPNQVIEFPRYTGNPYGHLIKQYLNGDFGNIDNVNTSLISLAYAGDRFLAKPMIEEWLKQKYLVIADRYVPSNKAYMSAKMPKGERQKFIDWLDDLEYNINGIPREELVIFLYVPPQMSQANIAKRGKQDHEDQGKQDIHEANLTYQQEVAQQYLNLAKTEDNWEVIECVKDGLLRTPQDIHQQILQILKQRKTI